MDPAQTSPPPRVPFTILTGYLGAGKTTALNRLLATVRARRVAVLVNELGRIAIDSQLILSRGGDVLELAGGCVCCKIDVKNDLWDGIVDVIARSRPDHVVLETTGVAEPAAIIDGLARRPELQRAHIQLAGIACVVDAEAGAAQLERRAEARAQVEAADRLMLSKLDVADPDTVAALHPALRALTAAEVASFPAGPEGDRALVHWLLDVRTGAGHATRASAPSHRHGQLVAVSLTADAPLLAAPLMALLDALGDRLVRAKGFAHLAGEPRRGFVERAGVRTALTLGAPWGDTAPRTELVLIGEGLDEAALRRQLWACRTADSPTATP
jgi:G3E family GTPase